tara:strand:+ start:6159 stop:7400 length:1242 start_codon:yes stop_codon:yes gene_type:complete
MPTLAAFGLDTAVEPVGDAPTEERAACLFVRRVAEEMRKASACFAGVASPHPPPPPGFDVQDAHDAIQGNVQRYQKGQQGVYAAPRKTDTAQWAEDTTGAQAGTEALLVVLGENNPILRDVLEGALEELRQAGGRRLMQRPEYDTLLTNALVTHPLMTQYGKDGIPGLTKGSCQALCEAVRLDDTNTTASHECHAYAFKRGAPFSVVDQTGTCYLMQNAGACKVEDFGIELYTRQITSERQCSAVAPGLDSTLNTSNIPTYTSHTCGHDISRLCVCAPHDRPDLRGAARYETGSARAHARRRGGHRRTGARPALPGARRGRAARPEDDRRGHVDGGVCAAAGELHFEPTEHTNALATHRPMRPLTISCLLLSLRGSSRFGPARPTRRAATSRCTGSRRTARSWCTAGASSGAS